MKNIVWTRIDDRLVHGQVMTLWVQQTSATEVVIVDDAVAKDAFIQMIMKSSMPARISLKVFGLADAVDYLNGEDDGKRVLILVKTPGTLVSLPLESVNVGGIGAKAGRKTLYKNISTSEAENQDLRNLVDKGIKVFFQVVVSDAEEPVGKYV